MNSSKNKLVALVLCIFGGYLGLHRFYVGKKASGVLYLLTGGGLGIGWIYDIFEILGNRFTDSAGRSIATGAISAKPTIKKWQFWVTILFLWIILINSSKGNSGNTNTPKSDDNISTQITSNIETMDEINKENAQTDINNDTETTSDTDINDSADTENTSDTDTNDSTPIEYDTLQKLFMELNKEYTVTNLTQAIEALKLPYTSEDYSSGSTLYIVAFSEGAARQTRADRGNRLKVSFDTNTGEILCGEYFNEATFATSLYYVCGKHWDFRFDERDNPYVGYYYQNDRDKSLPKTIMTYSNGHRNTTNYSRCDSAENALNGITIGQDFDPVGVQSEVESKHEEKNIESTAPHEKYEVSVTPTVNEYVFIINTDNNKIHRSTCAKGKEILPDHRNELKVQATSEYEAIQYVINQGYDPCGICMK